MPSINNKFQGRAEVLFLFVCVKEDRQSWVLVEAEKLTPTSLLLPATSLSLTFNVRLVCDGLIPRYMHHGNGLQRRKALNSLSLLCCACNGQMAPPEWPKAAVRPIGFCNFCC